ncbi:hypothetical protein SEPCBS119000_002999 [Sporothrix epigloea]|uniref:Uncharacterized protein n=1 Tax=Sporothrix epigloea TaxID=1892477 RepID=A0ABP0DJ69_9PEZI
MSYFYNAHQQHPTPATAPAVNHTHHGSRSRRAPRLSLTQNAHKQQQHQQYRQIRSIKEMTDSLHLTAFRVKFEAGRSFDLEDDMEFCPSLLSESDAAQQHTMKLHQPSATRARNPIPIVNPGSRPGSHLNMATPVPPSDSPSLRLPQQPIGSVW